MHMLFLQLRGLERPICFYFINEQKARSVFSSVYTAKRDLELVSLSDDFGHSADFSGGDVILNMLTHIEDEASLQIELKMIEQQASARMQSRMAADPTLALHKSLQS